MVPFIGEVREKIGALASNTIVRRGVAMTAAWLVIVNIFGLIAFNRLNISPDNAFEWMSPASVRPVPPSWDPIELHNRWDAYWYLDIAKRGYYLRGEKDIANVVFFPLYPLLMRTLAPLVGGNLVLSGWMVSSLFLILAVIMLIRLTQRYHPAIDPMLPAMFLLVYPTAFVLNAVYSESLFLFLSLGVVYYARRQNFLLASILTALASATRLAGLFLCVLLLAEFLQTYGWRSLFTRRVWPLTLAPAGAMAFFFYHWVTFGEFFLYFRIQDNWGRDFNITATDYVIRNTPYLVNMVYDLSIAAMSIVVGIIAMKKVRPSYGLYMLVSLGAVLSSGTALAIPRYSMVLFPIYIIAAGIRADVARNGLFFGSALLLSLTTIGFINHYWIG